MRIGWYIRKSRRNDGNHNGLWIFFGLVGLLTGAVMTLAAFLLKRKNAAYRRTLIELSDLLPEEEDEAAAAENPDEN